MSSATNLHVRNLGEESRRMDHCNDLCTKDATGTCAVCEARAEADRFLRFWFQGGLFVDGVHALKQWRQCIKKRRTQVDHSTRGVTPLVPPGGFVQHQGLRNRAEQLRCAADEAAWLAQDFYVSFLALGAYIAVIIGSTAS